MIWLVVFGLFLIGCTEETPKGTQPSEVLISQEAEKDVELSELTIESSNMKKVETLTQQNADGSNYYFLIYMHKGENSHFVVSGTYYGKAFSFELNPYDERIEFSSLGVSKCQTIVGTTVWDCQPIELE